MFRVFWRIYLYLSIFTFFVYGLDKFLAKAEWKRVPEKWLHTLALLGGFPGAALGMLMFHHKSRKKVFKWVFIASVLLHSILLAVAMGRRSWF